MAAVRDEQAPVPANEPDVARPVQRPVLTSVPFLKNGRPFRARQTPAAAAERSMSGFSLSLSSNSTSASRVSVARSNFLAEDTDAALIADESKNDADRAPAAYLWVKRVLDVTVAGLALVFLFPLLLLIALAVVIEGRGGPILFHQNRVGRNGRLFRFYKIRSMVPGAEALLNNLAAHNEVCGPIFKMRRDPRVTRVGRWLRKYSMDELPQLFNVLKGDMSLVGPRPHLPSEVKSYTPEQRRRLSVQPGLLCLREVGGRSHFSFEQWIESDLAYIKRRSLGTDLGILLRTLPAVFKGDGAY